MTRDRSYYVATAALGIRRGDEQWTKTKVISALKELGARGRGLTRNLAGTRLVSACVRYFGTFAKAKQRAGLA